MEDYGADFGLAELPLDVPLARAWLRAVAPRHGMPLGGVVFTVDLKTLSGFSPSVLRSNNWHLFKSGNIRKE